MSYVHCISKENFITQPRDLSCVELVCREVHVSFLDKMAERRVALLPASNGRHNVDVLFPSESTPALVSLKTSCDFTVRMIVIVQKQCKIFSFFVLRWQIKQARKHSKEKGPGILQEKTVQHRIRLPMAKVDHFIDFVNRPYFYQDVAYGTRVIKLATGEKLAMLNVVHTVTQTTIINQHLQYCDEETFSPLST